MFGLTENAYINIAVDHARLKEHVWSMNGRLDASIYEGGKENMHRPSFFAGAQENYLLKCHPREQSESRSTPTGVLSASTFDSDEHFG